MQVYVLHLNRVTVFAVEYTHEERTHLLSINDCNGKTIKALIEIVIVSVIVQPCRSEWFFRLRCSESDALVCMSL